MDERIDGHRRACDGFSEIVEQVAPDAWTSPSPCEAWDARGVLEHVIGFHEMLVLRPLGIAVDRPDDEPAARWTLTRDALSEALSRDGVLDQDVEPPGMGSVPLARLVPTLTTDVVVHTWDLARAAGLEVRLDVALCEAGLERALANIEAVRSSDMFGPEVPVADDADPQDRLLGIFGRDPAWSPTS